MNFGSIKFHFEILVSTECMSKILDITLPKFNSSPLKRYLSNRKGSSYNHHFSGAMLNFGGGTDLIHQLRSPNKNPSVPLLPLRRWFLRPTMSQPWRDNKLRHGRFFVGFLHRFKKDSADSGPTILIQWSFNLNDSLRKIKVNDPFSDAMTCLIITWSKTLMTLSFGRSSIRSHDWNKLRVKSAPGSWKSGLLTCGKLRKSSSPIAGWRAVVSFMIST